MTLTNPVVSVVIPTRNRPALLLRAVRSALGQTLREIEIIVVVDGEKGHESADAMARLDEDRVRCIVLREQAGGAEARNIGIRNARSAWIALLDDDDEWLPSKLKMQMDAVRHHDGSTAACGYMPAYTSRRGCSRCSASSETSTGG